MSSSVHHPLNLADIPQDTDFQLDPTLSAADTDLFLSAAAAAAAASNNNDNNDDDNQYTNDNSSFVDQKGGDGNAMDLEDGDLTLGNLDQLDDATVKAIKQSLSRVQAHADEEQRKATQAKNEASGSGAGPSSIGVNATSTVGARGEGRGEGDAQPITNPTIHLAPYSKPERGEHTPHPEYYTFPDKAAFELWLGGESSWCHFVQRRVTTPEKRAEERMRARVKTHEKMLKEMTPEEQAKVPALKKRRRKKQSIVNEKITYTCHHAGTYNPKHSTTLPSERLRMKTKKTVKCSCPARIMFTELQDGECKAQYYWKHEGHDPFGDEEHESGKLPKVIDDWLLSQIRVGKGTDEIRKILSISEEDKQAYVKRVTEDPSTLDPDMPPPLAFQMKINYSDIYNRFRKLRGPIRAIKLPKSKRPRSVKNNGARTATDTAISPPNLNVNNNNNINADFGMNGNATNQMGMDDSQQDGSGWGQENGDVSMDTQFLDMNYDSSMTNELNQQRHADLAQALMNLPGGEDDVQLSQHVLSMAQMNEDDE